EQRAKIDAPRFFQHPGRNEMLHMALVHRIQQSSAVARRPIRLSATTGSTGRTSRFLAGDSNGGTRSMTGDIIKVLVSKRFLSRLESF
ncbi:hypothetical protein SAMN05216403_1291, partial [Nitrosospira multiformis ATCC 25196]